MSVLGGGSAHDVTECLENWIKAKGIVKVLIQLEVFFFFLPFEFFKVPLNKKQQTQQNTAGVAASCFRCHQSWHPSPQMLAANERRGCTKQIPDSRVSFCSSALPLRLLLMLFLMLFAVSATRRSDSSCLSKTSSVPSRGREGKRGLVPRQPC